MVRRLIEQQNVRFLKQKCRKCQPCPFPARKRGNLLVVKTLVESHGVQNPYHFRLIGVAAFSVKAVLQFVQPVNQPGVMRVFCNLVRKLRNFVFKLPKSRKNPFDFLEDRPFTAEIIALFQVADSRVL